MTTNLEILTYETILLESIFVFVVECGEYLRFIPVDSPTSAVTGVFSDTRNILIRFVRSDVVAMLSHSGTKADTSLADVFRVGIAAAFLFVDATLFQRGSRSFITFA